MGTTPWNMILTNTPSRHLMETIAAPLYWKDSLLSTSAILNNALMLMLPFLCAIGAARWEKAAHVDIKILSITLPSEQGSSGSVLMSQTATEICTDDNSCFMMRTFIRGNSIYIFWEKKKWAHKKSHRHARVVARMMLCRCLLVFLALDVSEALL